jgi:FkbM family methyltransferase
MLEIVGLLARSLAVWRASRCIEKQTRRLGADVAPLRCTIAANRHGLYCVPASALKRPAGRLVVAGEVYEPETIDLVARHCGNGDIVHAGTYFGDLLPAFARTAAAEARIWAFEPNPESYRCAKVTIELNGLTNVLLTHAGLGASCGQASIRTRDVAGQPLGGCSHVVPHDGAEDCEAVDIRSIDASVPVERHVSVVQLDVEGHEQQALTGALATIRRCLPLLVLEVQPGSTLLESDWFRSEILGLGYRRLAAVHGNVVFQPH